MRCSALILYAVLASSALPATALAKKPPVTLQPASPWNAHYADDYCRLTRSFGTDRQQVVLILDRFYPGDYFRLLLAGHPMKLASPRATANIRFGSALPEQKLDFLTGTVGEKVPAWVFRESLRIRPTTTEESERFDREDYRTTPITEGEETSISEVYIGRPLRHPLVLATGPMARAFAALRTCTDELLTHWGIDVARHRELTRFATPVDSPARWLNSGDYPRAMLAKWQPGIVQFRLIVGKDGAPTSCHIQQSTNAEGFDEAVCKGLMRRARFEPALDKDGEPIISYYLNTVRFQFPGL